MKLLIDVGNTAVKLAVAEESELRLVAEQDIDWSQLEVVICSQVGRSAGLESIIAQAQAYKLPIAYAEVTPERAGVTCAYKEYNNLGIDRWLAVLAAHQAFPSQAVIVIDSGTATTVDVVSAQGEHLGGWIVPGLDLMVSSITDRAERVFCDPNTPFADEFANNTPQAVKNGALAATLGLVAQAQQLLSQQSVTIVCCGGYGKLLSEHLDQALFDELLVFKGLHVWWQNPQ